MNLPKTLLPFLQLEIEVNTRINERTAQWNFLQKWNGDQIREPIITNKEHSLVISRQTIQRPTAKDTTLTEHLDFCYAEPYDAPEEKSLELTQSNPILAHFQTETLLILQANFDNEGTFELIRLRYRNDLLSVPSTETQRDTTGFIPGLSFVTSKVNEQGERFQIGLRVFVEKKIFQQIIDSADSIMMITLPVIPQSHQQKYFELGKLKVPNRFHPYLPIKLTGGPQKMVSSEQFQVGGECWLTSLIGARKNVQYKFEYFVYGMPVALRGDELIEEPKLLSEGSSEVQKSTGRFFHRFARPLHFGQRVADFTSLGLSTDRDDVICSPAFVQIKVYELFKNWQVQYVGFADYPIPLLPGRSTVRLYLSCPAKDRFEAQKVQYGYSGLGTAVEPTGERLGLELVNFQMQVELEFNVFHALKYIQTAQGKKMADLGNLEQKMSRGVTGKLAGLLDRAGTGTEVGAEAGTGQ